MAYGPGGTGRDLNRNRQYPDVAGSTQGNAEGAIDISGSFKSFNPARLGEDTTNPGPNGETRNARVNIDAQPFQSSPPNYQAGNHYNFVSGGEPGLLGQDTDDYGPADTRPTGDDRQRPNLPNVDLAGESGTTNMGQRGDALDFNSVAPYEYPDFGDWPNPGAASNTIPRNKISYGR